MNWKINYDPFYKDLVQYAGIDIVKEAGYIEDKVVSFQEYDYLLNILCTPFNFLKFNKSIKNPCILLQTGSFNPIHSGHIENMILAKEILEKNNCTVIGGYFSPDHDEYVSTKSGHNLNINERIKLINDEIKFIDWLAIDSFNGIFTKHAINYTFIIDRLQQYLQKYLNATIPIVYLAGSDNARFSLTFAQKGNCAIIKRPNYEKEFQTYKERTSGHNNILWIENNNNSSSTPLRKEKITFPKKSLHLRICDDDKRNKEIINLLGNNFEYMIVDYLEIQIKKFNKIKEPIISLDPFIKGNHNIQISRNYDLFGSKCLGFINRPGSKILHEQIKNIPISDYNLFDDDSHTKATLNYITELLKYSNIKINEKITLHNNHQNEILDIRDFLLNKEESGLVITFDNKQYRVPYIYPYVDTYIRASINNPKKFSLNIWKINKEHFNNETIDNEYFRFFTDVLKFDKKMTIKNLCDFHISLLEYLI